MLMYQFEVSNVLGSVKECIGLVVHEGEGEDKVNLRQTFKRNPVTQEVAMLQVYTFTMEAHLYCNLRYQ